MNQSWEQIRETILSMQEKMTETQEAVLSS
jgi:hypothetical protein